MSFLLKQTIQSPGLRLSNDSTAWSKTVNGVKRWYVLTYHREKKRKGGAERRQLDQRQWLNNNRETLLFLLYNVLQPHLHLLSSGVHQLSDKVYCCRFPAHMDLLCTEAYPKERNTQNQSTCVFLEVSMNFIAPTETRNGGKKNSLSLLDFQVCYFSNWILLLYYCNIMCELY